MSKQTGIFRPLGLALVLAIGFGAVFALAAGWGISIWEGLRHQERVDEGLVVRADGTPLIQRNRYDGYHSYDGYQNDVTFHNLDGSEVPRPKENEGGLLGAASLARPRRDWIMFPLDPDARVARFTDGQKLPNLWYFLHDGARDGHGYFVGYDSESKLRVGFIGRDGFRPDPPPVEQWFPLDGVKLASGRAFTESVSRYLWYDDSAEGDTEFPRWKVNMISGTQLLEVDLQERSVTTLMESASLIAVGMLDTVSKSKAAGEEFPHTHRHQHLAVRTTDRVVVFDAPGKRGPTFMLPEGLRERSISLYELDAGRALVTASQMLPDHRTHEELFWIDGSGKVSRKAEIVLGEADPRHDENEAWTAALVVPAPVVVAFIAAAGPTEAYLRNGGLANYGTALAQSLAAFWPPLLVVTLLSAALAWYCCRRHRRYYQRASGVWFVFVLLTGIPGLVAYLFHRRWPVLEKCPACGQNVPRDRETCAACGAAFPPPEPKGCEVFA